MSIQVYRSSFPIVKWDLNDEDNALTKAEWAGRPADSALPQRGTPGAKVEWTAPADYAEPTRSGFEFAGWSCDKSKPAGGYLNAEPKLAFPEGAPEGGEYTLYALWMPLQYSVMFELAKNPDVGDGPGSDASFALNWSTEDGVRTVTDLGNGRYRVDGFTMKGADYDSATRTVKLPEPARTGYRFLGWAEATDASGVVVDGTDGYALNPVRLPQIDGTPVLTARWASAFGVTAPLSITFGDYDKTGAPGNPSLGEAGSKAATETTQSEADDTKTAGLTDQERYEALGAAYFENTGWVDPIKMVGIASERDASAGDVLTTYDSKQATEAAVLGDGTAANPGERLLSLYAAASAPADKSSGVHFRLSDSLEEGDLASLPSIAAKAKQPVTYGLNLATDPVDGSANHGLVLPTDDYDRKQIATVSYTFATADAASEDPVLECLYIKDSGRTYGLSYIKRAANDISTKGTASEYYSQFKNYLDSGMDPGTSDAQGYIEWGDGTTYNVRIIGINHDDKADGSGKAGLTFQFVDCLKDAAWMNSSSNTNSGGWASTTLRSQMNGGNIWAQAPVELRGDALGKGAVCLVSKGYRNGGSQSGVGIRSTADAFFIASYREMVSVPQSALSSYWSTICADGSILYEWWRQIGVNGTAASTYQPIIKHQGPDGAVTNFWTRSPYPGNTTNFVHIYRMYTSTDVSNRAYSAAFVCPCFCL